MTHSLFKTSLLTAILCLVACGGDDGTPAPPDAAPSPDAPPVVCKMAPSFAGTTIPSSITADHHANSQSVTIGVALNQDPDGFSLQLYPVGIFASGFTPGTYTIGTGTAEANYDTCALCVLGFGDAVSATQPGDTYFATAGSVTITEVGAAGSGNLKATLSNIVFEHVTVDATTSHTTPVNDGCTSTFTGDMVIDSPIVEGSAKAAAGYRSPTRNARR